MDEKELRSYCFDAIIRANLRGHNITETVRRADILYRYIVNGEVPDKGEEKPPVPLPDIPRDEPLYGRKLPRTPEPVHPKPVKG